MEDEEDELDDLFNDDDDLPATTEDRAAARNVIDKTFSLLANDGDSYLLQSADSVGTRCATTDSNG